MKDDLRYTTPCFETFPSPTNWEAPATLEAAGRAYYEFRAAAMVGHDAGLTQTYNRFHNPDERDAKVLRLRDLHSAMDREVLSAYGWSDVPTECEFLLDYEIDKEEWGAKSKPWRYRWPDEVRDEVLARLLELNRVRAEQERRAGPYAKGGNVLPLKPRTRKVMDSAVAEGLSLFGPSDLSESPPQSGDSTTDEESK